MATWKKYFEQQAEQLKQAREKGWMPAKPFKGRITKKMIGSHITVGYIDGPPQHGVIVETGPSVTDIQVLFFDMNGHIGPVPRSWMRPLQKVDSKEQIFSISTGKVLMLLPENTTIA